MQSWDGTSAWGAASVILTIAGPYWHTLTLHIKGSLHEEGDGQTDVPTYGARIVSHPSIAWLAIPRNLGAFHLRPSPLPSLPGNYFLVLYFKLHLNIAGGLIMLNFLGDYVIL